MKRVSFKGIIAGAVLVVVLDTIVAITLFALMSAKGQGQPRTPSQVADGHLEVTGSFEFLLASLVLGTLTTIIGGYCTARVAGRDPYLNSGILGVLGLVLGALVAGDYPLWFNIVAFLTVLPSSLVGGLVAKRQMEPMPNQAL